MTWVKEVHLKGSHVELAPLRQSHAADLRDSAAEDALHRIWYTSIPHPEQVEAEIDRRLGLQKAGTMLPFAVLDAQTKRAVGMTTYMNIDASAKRVEIGSTWVRKTHQKGPWNTQAKLLLLTHAFDELHCHGVELRTHFINHQSRTAIERLGAKLDGILRSNMVMADGTLRDTAVYSILAHEWPMVRSNLKWQMEKPRS